MKLANPLYYPIAVLAGAIALVLGVRVARLPSVVMIPVAAGVATVGAAVLRGREPETLGLDNPVLEQELQGVLAQARSLATRADELRAEATRLLTEINEMELLGTVQYACDRAHDLPGKVEELARRMHGSESLLSVTELQQQLREVQAKMQSSSGVARQSLETLATSLQRNIDLAQEGQDARQAQVVSLSTMILDAAGVLQSLQNKLRTADLSNASEATELRSLSEEFNSFQENVDLLVSK
jgi:hypothetical protein